MTRRQAEQVWPNTWTGEYLYDPWGVPEMWAFGPQGQTNSYAAEDYIPLDGRVVVAYRETALEEYVAQRGLPAATKGNCQAGCCHSRESGNPRPSDGICIESRLSRE